jgi:hypothetical protein
VPPGLLIFNDIRLRGFWLTGGYAKASRCSLAEPQLLATGMHATCADTEQP